MLLHYPPGENWREIEPPEDMLFHITYTDSKGKEQNFNLITNIQTDCEELGTMLGIEQSTLNGFHSKYRGDMKIFCKAVLDIWIKRRQGKYPATWGGLVKALRDVQLGGIATKLEKALELFYQQ